MQCHERHADNGMMAAMDDSIGEITRAVRARPEMYGNSIIVFSTVRAPQMMTCLTYLRCAQEST